MRKFLTENKLYWAGGILGAFGGYLYWSWDGCASGSCAITANPLNSTLYGTLMGALTLGLFKKDEKKDSQELKTNKNRND